VEDQEQAGQQLPQGVLAVPHGDHDRELGAGRVGSAFEVGLRHLLFASPERTAASPGGFYRAVVTGSLDTACRSYGETALKDVRSLSEVPLLPSLHHGERPASKAVRPRTERNPMIKL